MTLRARIVARLRGHLYLRLWHLLHGVSPSRRAIEADVPGAGPSRQPAPGTTLTDADEVELWAIAIESEDRAAMEAAFVELLNRYGAVETRRRLLIARENWRNLQRAFP